MQNKPQSLYIHIPFCKSKCHYCNFVSFTDKKKYIKDYFQSLKEEIVFYLEKIQQSELQTIYIGGGTPSTVEAKYFYEVLSFIKEKSKILTDPEITIEINPGTIKPAYINELKAAGINRISLGVQSFNDKILKAINRKHNAKDVLKAVELFKKAGFENISIDLIYGLPGQTYESWQEELKQAIKLEVQHISTYGLKIEAGTVFTKNIPVNLPDEDSIAQIYLKTIEILTENEFNHYEISNFAKPGFESRHNLCYWNNNEYIGVGVSAHGYINGVRYSNTESFENYLKNPLVKYSEHIVTRQEMLEEALFLGLRKREGVDIQEIQNNYNIDVLQKYSKVLNKYSEDNLLILKENRLKLTLQGILLSNFILAEFLAD